MISERLINSVIEHEGFRAKPYPDPIHGWEVPTFGHGLTSITESESRMLVVNRLNQAQTSLEAIYPWLTEQPQVVQEVVVEMAYQLGVRGVNQFRKMWAAIQQEDYQEAAAQILDSKLARQVPNRANDYAERMRSA